MKSVIDRATQPVTSRASLIAWLREIDTEVEEIDLGLRNLPPAEQLDPRSLAAADHNQLAYRRDTLAHLRGSILSSLFS